MNRACAAAVFAIALSGAAPHVLKLEGDIDRVHDPCIIKCKDTYYVFSTGGRPGDGVIPIHTSKDLTHWTKAGFVFPTLPDWAKARAYEGKTGIPYLQISTLAWEDGWPRAGALP